MRRRTVLIGGFTTGVLGAAAFAATRVFGRKNVPLGFVPDETFVEKARALLRRHPAIDIHAHPGRTFVRDASGLSIALRIFALRGSFEDAALDDMREGLVCGGSFSLVADFDLLD